MIRKVVYPYEYIETWKEFEKTKLLPKNVFYSKLNLNILGTSNNDHEYAQQV